MKLLDGQTIADDWLPTFENVSREFITETLYKILFSNKLPNFRFYFREEEAIQFIENVLRKYVDNYVWRKEKSYKILEKIRQGSNGNSEEPVMVVSDYKLFFEYLRQIYEKDIELFFQRTEMTGFCRYEKDNLFEQIWLRLTPNDFNNAEEFLRKQAQMIKDRTLKKYDQETYLGSMQCLNNHIVCIKNGIARTWDENFREIQIKIYDKEYYNDKECFYRPYYKLPVIRYGIYQKNGKKICRIGSIQDKNIYREENEEENNLRKRIDRQKYRVNKDISEEDISKVEPKNVIALSIFINLIQREGITDIEVPSMYSLDHEYHRKGNKTMLEQFKKRWPKERRKKQQISYQREYKLFLRGFRKEDLISEIKTERLLLTFRRILNHYPKGNVTAYPEEVDNYMHIQIPIVKDSSEIKGDILKEFYNLVQTLDIEKRNDIDQQEIPTLTHDNEIDGELLEETFSL